MCGIPGSFQKAHLHCCQKARFCFSAWHGWHCEGERFSFIYRSTHVPLDTTQGFLQKSSISLPLSFSVRLFPARWKRRAVLPHARLTEAKTVAARQLCPAYTRLKASSVEMYAQFPPPAPCLRYTYGDNETVGKRSACKIFTRGAVIPTLAALSMAWRAVHVRTHCGDSPMLTSFPHAPSARTGQIHNWNRTLRDRVPESSPSPAHRPIRDRCTTLFLQNAGAFSGSKKKQSQFRRRTFSFFF